MALKLKSSSRINLRYALLEAKSKEEVEKTILDYIGILGWAKARPYFVKSEDKIILAVERKMLNDVRAAFALSKNVKVKRVSGTLKGLGVEIN